MPRSSVSVSADPAAIVVRSEDVLVVVLAVCTTGTDGGTDAHNRRCGCVCGAWIPGKRDVGRRKQVKPYNGRVVQVVQMEQAGRRKPK